MARRAWMSARKADIGDGVRATMCVCAFLQVFFSVSYMLHRNASSPPACHQEVNNKSTACISISPSFLSLETNRVQV